MEDRGIEFNYESVYRIGEQDVHFAKYAPYAVRIQIIEEMKAILLTEDPVTGVVEDNYLMRGPVTILSVLKLLSDMDLSSYNDEDGKGIFDLFDVADAAIGCKFWMYPFVAELMAEYEEYKKEIVRVSNDRNAIGAQLRVLAKYGFGEKSSRDIGIVRRILTDAMLKAKGQPSPDDDHDADGAPVEEVKEPRSKASVVDLSAYKVKKDKGK